MTNYTLIIGTKNWSSWSLRPWLLLRVKGIPFKEVEIPLRTDSSKERILEHSPSGQVPVLKIAGGATIWDSLAICETLAERHADLQLWPADSEARSMARSVSAEMHSGFRALREQMPMDIVAPISATVPSAETQKDIKRIEAIWESCRSRRPLGGPFLFGAFGIADALYAPVVTRFVTYGVQLSGLAQDYAESIGSLPALAEWREACAAWAAARTAQH